ncbi:hypothetical protein J6590_059391 [Homalodisca vitripennis]|nr:hypothetical protein J6590_059391 [Homalodisca vitripennis]
MRGGHSVRGWSRRVLYECPVFGGGQRISVCKTTISAILSAIATGMNDVDEKRAFARSSKRKRSPPMWKSLLPNLRDLETRNPSKRPRERSPIGEEKKER